jgi:hypothetical protein
MNNRRDFLRAGLAAASVARLIADRTEAQPLGEKMVGMQVGAVSFVDEGTDAVLDIFQSNGINTLFLATLTYGRGVAGPPAIHALFDEAPSSSSYTASRKFRRLL